MTYQKKGYANTYTPEKAEKMRNAKLERQHERMKLFLEMYPKCDCNLTRTCQTLGISAPTVRQWKVDYPDFKKAVDDAYITVVNKAEAQLQKLIDKGNPAAIMFFLKCKGGYVENQKLDINANVVSKQLVLNVDPFAAAPQNQTITINDTTDDGVK